MGRETGAILSIRFQQITIRKIVLEFVISSALFIQTRTLHVLLVLSLYVLWSHTHENCSLAGNILRKSAHTQRIWILLFPFMITIHTEWKNSALARICWFSSFHLMMSANVPLVSCGNQPKNTMWFAHKLNWWQTIRLVNRKAFQAIIACTHASAILFSPSLLHLVWLFL